jgi:NADPH2:quinone reductase
MIHVVEVRSPGGPEALELAQRPDPVPAQGEIVVRVRAANINPTDLASRAGFSFGDPIKTPFVVGWDYAGIVQSVGEGASEFKVGDRVVGMIPWYLNRGAQGAYAEAVAVKSEWTLPLPDSLDFATACTLPLNALTAKQALALMKLPPASEILINGASGAVGGFAVQMAVQAGHRVTAVAGRDDEAWVRNLGAKVVLPRSTDYRSIGRFKFAFDAVPVGDPVLEALDEGGVVVTTRPTPKADPKQKIQQLLVLISFDRSSLREIVALAAAGKLQTRIERRYPLSAAADAHRDYERGGHKGKLILEP